MDLPDVERTRREFRHHKRRHHYLHRQLTVVDAVSYVALSETFLPRPAKVSPFELYLHKFMILRIILGTLALT